MATELFRGVDGGRPGGTGRDDRRGSLPVAAGVDSCAAVAAATAVGLQARSQRGKGPDPAHPEFIPALL